MSENILEIRGLCKYFGSTIANKDVDFDVRRGEVRGLAGENGSGKSTLLSQISGIYLKDEGEMHLNGEIYDPKNPMDATKRKIGIVVQELGVLQTLPAAINVFAGRLDQFTRFGIINMKKVYSEARAQFEKWGLTEVSLKPSNCHNMPIETRKMIELARALSIDPDILILDEVTQSLSQNNREMLYRLIERMKDAGKTVILITHDLEEMLEICDSVTVLRDGEVVATESCDTLTMDKLKLQMVGREITGDYYRNDLTANYKDHVVMKAEDLTIEGQIHDVSFELHEGEILGFCGLSDSGIHTVGKALYGLEKDCTGNVVLTDENLAIKNERVALASGMAYVPKDRDNEALMTHDSIRNNLVFPSMKELEGAAAFLNPAKLGSFSKKAVEDYQVKCTGIDQVMDGLSGGNKQKVNVGRWLMKDLKVIILDCPTRGVDIGVKAYIYHLMSEAKKSGLAMILISDELPEIIGMSDRVIIMKDGRVSGVFDRNEELTQENLIGVMV